MSVSSFPKRPNEGLQGQESPIFKSLLKKGIVYLSLVSYSSQPHFLRVVSTSKLDVDAHDKKRQQQESRATADRRGSQSLSKTARIEMHQSELLKTNKLEQSIMLYKITHDRSTPSPEED